MDDSIVRERSDPPSRRIAPGGTYGGYAFSSRLCHQGASTPVINQVIFSKSAIATPCPD
jgi:hypothetical protein